MELISAANNHSSPTTLTRMTLKLSTASIPPNSTIQFFIRVKMALPKTARQSVSPILSSRRLPYTKPQLRPPQGPTKKTKQSSWPLK